MNLLEQLNDQQKEAVLHLAGPLLIVAGAGAGKTKTITHRIAHLIASGVEPRSILAVTFTNKAAAEMRERIGTLLNIELSSNPFSSRNTPLITTFHSLGVRLLREFAAEAGIPKNFSIWDRDDSTRAIKRVLTAAGLDGRFPPKQVLSKISREKGDGTTAAEFKESAHSFYDEAIANTWLAYEIVRTKEGALDFDDLLLQVLTLLKTREDVREALQKRWSHLTIDEYQDTNKAQYEIARLLAGEAHNICVVGDIDQNIYSWRGADITHLLGFEKTFPNTKTILLEQNYRSTQTILTAANAVISKNTRRFDKRLVTNNPTGEAITVFAGPTERDEAYYITQSVRELLQMGVRPKDIAVLYRENFQSRAIEEAFIRQNIPYRMLGTKFFERAEVKDVLSYLKAARNPSNIGDFARAAQTPPRGIGKTTLEKIAAGGESALSGAAKLKVTNFRGILAKIAHATTTMKASEAVRYTITLSGLEEALSQSKDEIDRLGNVQELASNATRYDHLEPGEGIDAMLEDAALMSEQDGLVEEKNAVSLMTVHASKGLEFDAVFVTGLEQGLFPSEREGDASRDPEEERRLFYVALTRARKHLFLTLAGSRLKYGQREQTIPSTFLDDIDSRLLVYADSPMLDYSFL